MLGLTSNVQETGSSDWKTPGPVPFAPQYGYAPLRSEDLMDDLPNASASKVDVLIGSTEDKASLFTPPHDRSDATVAHLTNLLYLLGDQQFARLHVQAGGKASLYRILWSAKGNPIGATHAIELPLLFGDGRPGKDAGMLKGSSWEDIDQTGRQLRKLWADFAKGRQLDEEDGIDGLIASISTE